MTTAPSPFARDLSARELRWIPIQGDSMWPSLRSGDEAAFAPAAAVSGGLGPLGLLVSLCPGDVVVARLEHALVAHRVVAVDAAGGAVVLRGDNCAEDDGRIPAGAIYGVVTGVKRDGVTLEHWDRGPQWLGLLRLAVKRRVARALGRAA